MAQTAPPSATPVTRREEYDLANDIIVPLCVAGMLWCFSRFAFDVRSVFVSGDTLVLRFVLFWFLIGVVGITKIEALRGGPAVALPYKLGLGIATFVFVLRYSMTDSMFGGGGGPGGSLLLNLAIFAAIWWGATAMTRDCSVTKETEERESRGLLDFGAPTLRGEVELVRRGRPGKSVFYFSAFALVSFGVGQVLLGQGAEGHYRSGFYSVAGYVFFTLVLLAVTNFSGLRLYLVGKRLEPPRQMLSVWMGMALALVAVVMVLALILPRTHRGADRSVMARGINVSSDRQATTPWAPTSGTATPDGHQRTLRPEERDGTEAGGERGGEAGGGEESSDGGEDGAGAGSDGSSEGGGEGEGEGEGSGERQGQTEGEREGRQTSRQQSGGSPPSDLWKLLAWVLIALAVLLLLWMLWRSRGNVWAALRGLAMIPVRMWQALAALLGRFGRRRPEGPAERKRPRRPPVYPSPFGSGDSPMSPTEIVGYTYEALMAHSEWIGAGRRQDQTAAEFVRYLPEALRPIRGEIRDLTEMYIEAEYSPMSDFSGRTERLQAIWHRIDGHFSALAREPEAAA